MMCTCVETGGGRLPIIFDVAPRIVGDKPKWRQKQGQHARMCRIANKQLSTRIIVFPVNVQGGGALYLVFFAAFFTNAERCKHQIKNSIKF